MGRGFGGQHKRAKLGGKRPADPGTLRDRDAGALLSKGLVPQHAGCSNRVLGGATGPADVWVVLQEEARGRRP